TTRTSPPSSCGPARRTGSARSTASPRGERQESGGAWSNCGDGRGRGRRVGMAEVARRGQELLEQIAQTRTEPGRVAFWWLGQHSFILKGGETVVYIDPYLTPDAARQTPP